MKGHCGKARILINLTSQSVFFLRAQWYLLLLYYMTKKKKLMSLKECVSQVISATLISQFNSVAQSCPTLCHPIDCSTRGLPVHTNSQRLLKLMFTELVMPSNHLILCRPLLLLPSVFPSIRVFSSESVLCIR